MKSANLRSLPVILLAAAAGLASCKKPMTYVHVKILEAPGKEPAPITDIELDLDLAGRTTKVHLTNGAAPIQFPTDVTLEIKTGSGQLAIVAICKNASGAEVDRATGTVQVNSGAIAEAALQLPGGKPDLVPTEAQHDFTSVVAGQTSPSINFTFHNVGFVASGAATVALGGVGAAQFAIGVDGCTGVKVAPDGSCAVSVVFQPVIVGPIAATLTVSATPGGSAVVAITGTGQSNPQNISVTISGNGSGSLAVNPAAPPCTTATAPCTRAFEYGTVVTFTPTPAPGSHFGGWTGDCTGTGACTVTATQARTVDAAFMLDSEPLTVTIAGTGSGSVSDSATGFTCATANGSCIDYLTYDPSNTATVTLTASSDLGSDVTWTGCTTTSGSTCTITGPIISAASVTATFTKVFAVNVVEGGNGSGTVVSDVGGINCTITGGVTSGICSADVIPGTNVTLTASLAPNTASILWSGGCTPSGNTCTLTNITTPPATSVATFTLKQFPVVINSSSTASAGSGTITGGGLSCTITNGVTSGTCSTPVIYGSGITLSAVANSGSAFLSWSGGCTGTGSTCTISSITSAPAATTATFTKTFSVAVAGTGSSPGAGSGVITGGGLNCSVSSGVASGTCSTTVNYGASLGLTEAPATGSNFNSWSANCTGTGTTCSTGAVTSNLTVTAAFKLQTESLTVNTNGGNAAGSVTCAVNGGASGACPAAVNYGDKVTFTASPGAGAIFSGWTGCASSTNSCILASVIAPATVTAGFASTLCAAGVVSAQTYSTSMAGCAATATYANRASACAAGTHVCGANEWVANQGGNPPVNNYWVDEALNYSNGSGVCGTGGCGATKCFATSLNDPNFTLTCNAGQPMHVCAPTGTDKLGNTCTWTGCGFNSIAPNTNFGGCSGARDNTAGTLCCSNSARQFYVDLAAGLDSNPGTKNSPFQHITKALRGREWPAAIPCSSRPAITSPPARRSRWWFRPASP